MAFKLPKLSNSSNYLKNATKSIAFIAADIAKHDLVPDIADFADSNKEFVKATFATLRTPKMKDRRNIMGFMNTKIFQSINYGLNNLKQDLSTGDFYAKARQEEAAMEMVGFDMSDWDDLSEFGIDDDWEKELENPSPEQEITKGDKAIVSSIEGTSAANARATVNAIIGANEQTIKNTRANTAMLFQQQEKIFGSMHNDLSAIGATLQTLFGFQSRVFQNIDKNLSEFQTEILKQTNEQTAILKDILEIERNKYKSAQERELERSEKRSSKRKRIGDIYSFDDYFENIISNAKEELEGFGLSFGGDGGIGVDDIIKYYSSAPVKAGLNLVMSSLIPNTIKTASKALNDSFTSIFSNIVSKANKNKDDFGFLGIISRIFGLKDSVSTKLSTRDYEKGPVPWDGIARKALTSVIPGYLARIEAFLTGHKIQDYDFDNGRWQDLAKGKAEFDRIKTENYDRALYEFKESGFEEAVRNKAPVSDTNGERTKWNNAVKEFYKALPEIYKNYGGINVSNRNYKDYGIASGTALADHFAELVEILDSYDKEEYVDSKGRRRTRYTKSSVKNRLPGEFMRARSDQQRQIEDLQALSHGSAVKAFEYKNGVIPEFTQSFADKLAEKMGANSLSESGIQRLFEYRDNYGNTLHTYLYNINRELTYMRMNGLAPAAAGQGVNIATGSIDSIDLTDHAYINARNQRLEDERIRREAAEAARQQRQATKTDEELENERKLNAFKKMLPGDDLLIDLRDFGYGEGEYALELSKLVARGQTKKLKEIYSELNGSDAGYDEKTIVDVLNKQFINAGITSSDLYQTAIDRANSTGKKTFEVITDQERNFLNRILRKLNIAREGGFLDRITAAPAQAFSNILYSADRAIYDMFFKYQFKDRDGNAYEGFLDFLTGETKNVFTKLEEKLLNPLKTRIETWLEDHGLGKEKRKEYRDRFLGTLKGGLSSFGKTVSQGTKEAFVYPLARTLNAEKFASSIRSNDDVLYNSAIKTGKSGEVIKFNKVAAESLKSKRDEELKAMQSSNTLNSYLRSRGFAGTLNQRVQMLKGYANSDEERAEIINRITRATSYAESEYNEQVQAIKDDPDMPIGEKKAKLAELKRAYESKQNDILNKIFARFDIDRHAKGTVTGLPFTGNTMLTKGEVVINGRGASIVPKTGLYNVKNSHIINTEDAHDYLGVKGPRKSVAQAQQDEDAAERKIFNNAEGTLTLKDIVNGKSIINKNVKVDKNQIAEMIKTAKENIPELAAGGVLGAVVSGVLGLVGGPLVGAAVGAGIGLAKRSEALKTVLFGKLGEDGTRENNGLIKTEVQNAIKKYAPEMAKSGAAGFIASLVTPLGPLGGVLIGSAIGFLKQNDELREKLFGKLNINESDKDIIKKLAPGAIKGAAIGAVATMFGGPFGLVGNTIVGSAIGMMSTTEDFKKLMLGQRINGVLQGGILQPIKDAFAPIAEAGNEFKDRLFATIDDNIILPIQRFLKPTIHALPRALGFIPRMIGKFIFNSKFGLKFSGLLQDVVAKPIIAALTPAAKLAGGMARFFTLPVRLLGAAGNKIHKGQIDKRTDTYELASERVAFNTDVLGRKSSAYDLALAGIGTEGGMSVERAKNISQAITLYTTSRETLSKQKKGVERQITGLLNKWRGINNQSLPRKVKAACVKAINSGATYKIADILKQAGLSNDEFTALWGQLKPLIDTWTELRTKEQEARNMTDADKTQMGKDLRAAFNTELGLKGAKLNFNNMDQLNNIVKQLNMEVENREDLANLKAPELEIKENVTDIRDAVIQMASKGIKIQDGTDEDYQNKIQDIINRHNATESTSIREALARGTKASEEAVPEGASEAVRQEATRMTSFKGVPVIGSLPIIRKAPIIGKYGKHIEFKSKINRTIDKYSGELNKDILNALAEVGKLTSSNVKNLSKLYEVFLFDAEAAKLIVSKTSRRISGLIHISKNEYFKEYIQNRTNNIDYLTTREIEYLLSISDSSGFTRSLLRKLKLVSDCGAHKQFNSIEDIGTMSGDTEAALQSGRALGQSTYYNFFEDQETNQQIQEARQNRPEHHGLGTMLINGLGSIGGGLLKGALGLGDFLLGGVGGLAKGALGLGGSILGGIGKLLFGNKNKDQEQAQTVNNDALALAAAAQASQNIQNDTAGAQTAMTGDTDKRGDGKETIYTNEGAMTLKRSNDGSLVPDTDQDTKATLNKKSLKDRMLEKVQAAQLASSEAITKALDFGKAAGRTAKKGMGWLTKLLLGGMLANAIIKSGILGKVKDWFVKKAWPGIKEWAVKEVWPNVKTFFTDTVPTFFNDSIKPIWTDHIKPWMTEDVAPFITGTVIPKIGEVLGTGIREAIPVLLSGIGTTLVTTIKNLPALLKTGASGVLSFFDALTGNKTNTGGEAKTNLDALEEKYGKDGLTTIKDENGNYLTVKQLKDGDYKALYNNENTKGEFNKDTGEITFKDQSVVGSSTAKTGIKMFVNSLASSTGRNLTIGITDKIAEKSAEVQAKKLLTKGIKATIDTTNTGLSLPAKAADKVIKSPAAQKIMQGISNLLEKLLGHNTIIAKLRTTVIANKISDVANWLKSFKDKVISVFTKQTSEAVAQSSDDMVAAAASSASSILTKLFSIGMVVINFGEGYDTAESLLKVSEVSILEEFMCGIIHAICCYFVFLIPFEGAILKLLSPLLIKDLEERQAKAKEEYDKYVEENNSNMTEEEYFAYMYSHTGRFKQNIKNALSNIFKDDTVTTMENSPSLAAAYNNSWDFTGNMTDADIAKKYSEMTAKKLQSLENNAIYEARDGGGYNTELLKRIEYIKKNNPELITNNPDSGYLWTANMSKDDILQMYENYKTNDPNTLATMESDYRTHGGLGWNGEFLERYYNIINGKEDAVAKHAEGTVSLTDVLKAKLPTDNELNNSTGTIGINKDNILENNVGSLVRSALTKLAGGIFGSVKTTMKDYATAIRASIANFAQEDSAIRAVQEGNLSIFSEGYWNFGNTSDTMGDILNDMAVGMSRTVAAPLLVVKSAMKSLTEDIKNIGPWMTTHFAELAGFFLHPMDYIYNEVIKNFLYAQSENISGYVSPEGAVLTNIMNPYSGGSNIIKSSSSNKTGSSGSATTTSGTTGTTTSTTEEGSTGTSLIGKVIEGARNIGKTVSGAVGNVVNGVVNFFTGNKKPDNKDNTKDSLIDRAARAAQSVGSTAIGIGRTIGSTVINAGKKVGDFAGNVISSAGSFLSGLFGKGKYSKQIDPSIARLRYNARGDSEYQTIGDSACGPAAAVNVIESMYGRGVNPVLSASNYALSHGYKEQNGGTRPEFFTDYFGKHGLESDITYDKSTVERNINAGIPTVLMGSDANGTSSSHPFGSNPHYVTVTGTDGRGHAIVQDPESRYDDQVYDIKDLVKRTSIGVSAYGRKRKYGRGISKSRAKSIISKINESTAGNHNLPSRKQVLSHYTNPKFGTGRFGRGRDVENQDLCVWADVSGEEIDNFIKGYAGTDIPFYGNGALFVEIGESTGMDPVYILAHSACESSWGKSQYARERGNYFGIGAYDDNPDNAHTMASSNGDFHPDGLLAGVKWIKENYYDAGQTTLYLFNHAANGWHNYRTSSFDTEVGIMNSCYDSISGYDSRQKKKHTGDGRSVAATSANTNNSNGPSSSNDNDQSRTVTTKDTRNMMLVKGIVYTKDLEGKSGESSILTINNQNKTPSTVASPSSVLASTRDTSNDRTLYDEPIGPQPQQQPTRDTSNDRTLYDEPIGPQPQKQPTTRVNKPSTNKPSGKTTTTTKPTTLYEEPIGPQPQKQGLFTKIVNGVKKIFGKGHPYEDGRSVTKYGRGEEQSVGEWINRTQTDSPAAQVFNSFLDTIGTNNKQNQQENNNKNNTGYTVSSSDTVNRSAGANNITGSGLAADVVRIAQHEAELTDGTNMENPNNSNSVKYNDWYYGQHVSGDAYPWCAAFVSWVLNQAGVSESILPKSALAKDFYDAVNTHVSASDSLPGDIVTFSSTGSPSDIYHVGIVENASGGKLNTIEGNTYQGSGDWGVYRVNYDLGDNRLLISHPNYGTGNKESKPMSKYGRAKDFFRRRKPSYGMGNRASEVWNWFRTHGYSEAATAGILGNMEQESGVDPELIQDNGAGPAAGIVQWEDYNAKSKRWLNMSNYAQSKGRNWTDLESQLEFIDKENKEGSDVFWSMADTYKSYDAFKNADDIIAATDSFEQAFERAGIPAMQNRYDAANKYYSQFTGKDGDKIGSSDTSGSSGGNQSADSGLQSVGQWLNRVLTDSPVAQVLNSFLDIGGSSNNTIQEGEAGEEGDTGGYESSEGGNYTGNSALNSTPGSGGNSPLATVTVLTGNNGGPRGHEIDTLTIHYMAGDMTAEECGNWFANPSTQASSNYGVDSNGIIGLYVDEGSRSWASANPENDDRAVTIEVANQPDGSPTQAAYNALIDLCADICIRNGIPKLLWKNDPNLVGQINQQNMTLHKWVSTMAGGTDCPGPWFSAHMGDIANDVNAKLGGSGKGKFGRGAGVKIDTSKLGFNKGLGKDGKGIFGRGKTTKSVPQSKLNLLRKNKSPLYTPAHITAQIAESKANTKKQRFAKTLAELTNGRGEDPTNTTKNKYGKGNTKPYLDILFEDTDYPITKYSNILSNIAYKPTESGDMLFEDAADDNLNIGARDTITPTDLFEEFIAGQAEEDISVSNTPSKKVRKKVNTVAPTTTEFTLNTKPIRKTKATYVNKQPNINNTAQSSSINYMGIIKEIVSILLKVANNTDKLNTIITILQDKLDINVSAKDVADAQANTVSSTAKLANALMNANNRSTNLNAYADSVNNASINSIITAMNAIASE